MDIVEFENMILGTNRNEDDERIENQPIWDIRCWLEDLNQGVYSEVIMDRQSYTNADELFREIVSFGDYEKIIEDGNILTVDYENRDSVRLEGICQK